MKKFVNLRWRTNSQSSKISLLAVFVLVLVFCFVVFLDIPIARQVIGFLFITFVPGLIFLKILRLDKFDGVETVLFVVGLSVAFLMLAGLLTNEVAFLFGISRPLSLIPLMIGLNSLILLGIVIVYLRNEDVKIWKSEPIEKPPFVLLLLCLPILSIAGAMYVNACGSNLLVLFTIVAISLLLIVGVLSKKLLPSKFYPFAVLMITIAILYHSALISNYIVPFGSDVASEYFVFRYTQNNAHWSATLPYLVGLGYGRYNTMLSISILPTVYINILNIDSTWVFKALYPLIFSLVPLGLYQLWQAYVGKKFAFASAFLLIAQWTFYTEMLGLNRQMIAELFFVLLLLVILNKKMKPVNKIVCFMIFSFALVTSHYALSEILLFFIALTLISLIIVRRPSKSITVPMVVFFFLIMFTWYIYISRATTFDSLLEAGDFIYGQLGDFFNPASRGETVMTGLGMTESPSIWNTIGRGVAYLTQALIVLGFGVLVTKRTRISIEREYLLFSLTGVAFLAMLILVPGLAKTLNMTRFYHILLFFLAPFCIIGVQFIVKLFFKLEKEFVVSALLLIVLLPYFLFQTNFVYEVTRSDSWSIPLSGYRMDALRLYGHYGYADAYSVRGAQWLSKNVDARALYINKSAVYADVRARANVLTIYGLIFGGYVRELSNTTRVTSDGVVYLNTLNVVEGVIPFGGLSWNTSELSFVFDDLDIIYANGGSEIYGPSP